MRFSSFRTYWIAIISLLVMLTSGFASSASMMSMSVHMMSSEQMSHATMSEEHHAASNTDSDQDCLLLEPSADLHAQHRASPNPPSETEMLDCSSDPTMVHNCCTATCFSAVALISPNYQSEQHVTKLALIHLEQGVTLIARVQSLYRPPIA
ncbi:hypothetical protein [Enterovibrio calviensis]|uniref:hypothetical protein n=1 Tax=Enterovibrio calviensis TaxID=91359 RepID=UPI0037364D8A